LERIIVPLQSELSLENTDIDFPASRAEALKRLEEFEKTASRYSSQRNYVVPGHTNVSRLSPAIRHRLITEEEVAKYVMHRYAFSTVEKFLQEVYWRRYWKSWLSLRPQVWSEYLEDLKSLNSVESIGSVAVMNDFANELIETGYLHNHARMWFAGYWVHTLKLPWQLGAAFFYEYLLDADPASNTLSWRWIAGLQTPGKTYLARRSNIEKYLHPSLLKSEGLEQLENGRAVKLDYGNKPEVTSPEFENQRYDPKLPTGFWMHEEDFSAESLFDKEAFQCVFVSTEPVQSDVKKVWLDKAKVDAVARCKNHFNVTVSKGSCSDMIDWAKENGLSQVIAMRPDVGPINDQLHTLEGINIIFKDREEDLQLRPLAKAGFFGFWKKIAPMVIKQLAQARNGLLVVV